jgi:hypothetical protein
VILFLVVGVLMYRLNIRSGWSDTSPASIEGELYRAAVEQLHQLRPVLRKGSRVLFLDEPFHDAYHDQNLLHVVLGLLYRDFDLVVDSARFFKTAPDAARIASYDYVFDYRHGRFFAAVQPRLESPRPTVAYEWGHPAFFHADWAPIRAAHPAKRQELVLSMVADLCGTQSPIPRDQPFPSGGAFLEAVSPVEVLVDGQPAEIVTKIGWPEKVNLYRVDFRIPGNVRSGQRAVQVTCRGATGPSAVIPVQ